MVLGVERNVTWVKKDNQKDSGGPKGLFILRVCSPTNQTISAWLVSKKLGSLQVAIGSWLQGLAKVKFENTSPISIETRMVTTKN